MAAGANLGLRKLAPSGSVVGRWDSSAAAVATDRRGNIYTIAGNVVRKRTESGIVTATWSVPSPDSAANGSPVGLAVAPDGTIDVDVAVEQGPDTSCPKGCYGGVAFSVEQLSPDGALRRTWRAGECSEFSGYCLWQNVPMAVEPGGRLLIGDKDTDQVLTFLSDGTRAGSWGSRGHDAGQFEGILGLAQTANGRVLVVDAENGRLQILTRTGRPLRQWGGGTAPGQFLCPSGVTVAPNGSAFVRDVENNRVQRLAPNGRTVGTWHIGPPGVAPQLGEYCGGYTAGIGTDR